MSVFFLKWKEETVKVANAGEVDSHEKMEKVFAVKFPGNGTAEGETVSFYTKDQQYGVNHRLEEFGTDDLYDGTTKN